MTSRTVAQTWNYADVSSQLWKSRREVREDILRRYPDAKLIDTFDGLFGFVLDLPARSFTGLVSSPAELKYRTKVGFWQSALEDGFNIVPNFGYVNVKAISGEFEIIDEFHPPSSPMSFFRIKQIQKPDNDK